MKPFKIELTPIQAKILFNTIDGAADAGSCSDGCTKQELRALNTIMHKLLCEKEHWIAVALEKG